MLKRLIYILSAAAVSFTLAACSSKEESSDKKVEYDTEFATADSFFLPPSPPMCQYTYTAGQLDTERITDLADVAFGGGAFGRGVCLQGTGQTVSGDYNTADWYNETEQISAHIDEIGDMSFFKGKYSTRYTEEQKQKHHLKETIYSEDFDRKVTLDGETVSLNTLTLDAQENIYDCFDAAGVSAELVPLCAKQIADENEKVIYVCLDYCVKFGTSVMTTEAFSDSTESFGASLAANSYPRVHAYYYTPDDIQGILAESVKIDDIRQGETISSPIDAEAAMKMIEEKADGRPADYTLMHCQLEYRPVSEEGGVIKAMPYWAFYYRDGEGLEYIIAVNASSGEVVGHALQS